MSFDDDARVTSPPCPDRARLSALITTAPADDLRLLLMLAERQASRRPLT